MRTCFHCQKEIEGPHVYIGVWCHPTSNSLNYYHFECFEHLAGEDYVNNLLKAKDQPDVENILDTMGAVV